MEVCPVPSSKWSLPYSLHLVEKAQPYVKITLVASAILATTSLFWVSPGLYTLGAFTFCAFDFIFFKIILTNEMEAKQKLALIKTAIEICGLALASLIIGFSLDRSGAFFTAFLSEPNLSSMISTACLHIASITACIGYLGPLVKNAFTYTPLFEEHLFEYLNALKEKVISPPKSIWEICQVFCILLNKIKYPVRLKRYDIPAQQLLVLLCAKNGNELLQIFNDVKELINLCLESGNRKPIRDHMKTIKIIFSLTRDSSERRILYFKILELRASFLKFPDSINEDPFEYFCQPQFSEPVIKEYQTAIDEMERLQKDIKKIKKFFLRLEKTINSGNEAKDCKLDTASQSVQASDLKDPPLQDRSPSKENKKPIDVILESAEKIRQKNQLLFSNIQKIQHYCYLEELLSNNGIKTNIEWVDDTFECYQNNSQINSSEDQTKLPFRNQLFYLYMDSELDRTKQFINSTLASHTKKEIVDDTLTIDYLIEINPLKEDNDKLFDTICSKLNVTKGDGLYDKMKLLGLDTIGDLVKKGILSTEDFIDKTLVTNKILDHLHLLMSNGPTEQNMNVKFQAPVFDLNLISRRLSAVIFKIILVIDYLIPFLVTPISLNACVFVITFVVASCLSIVTKKTICLTYNFFVSPESNKFINDHFFQKMNYLTKRFIFLGIVAYCPPIAAFCAFCYSGLLGLKAIEWLSTISKQNQPLPNTN